MATHTRLMIGAAVVLCATAYMAYLGASSSWQYYLSTDECVASAASLIDAPVRVSGQVASDSLRLAGDRKTASFTLRGAQAELQVQCTGQLPDHLLEGRHVVVEGRLASENLLICDKLLTRCASKYAPQPVAEAGGNSAGPNSIYSARSGGN